MKITEPLRKYLREKFGLLNASDDQIKAEVAKRLGSGELSTEKLFELQRDTPADPLVLLDQRIDARLDAKLAPVLTGIGTLTETVKAFAQPKPPPALEPLKPGDPNKSPDPMEVLMEAAKGHDGGHGYSRRELGYETKSFPITDKEGKPRLLPNTGEPAMHLSELQRAKAGVYLRHMALRKGIGRPFNLEERKLYDSLFDDDWCGDVAGEYHKVIPGREVKALLSDSTSGGDYLNPFWFDAAVIVQPLLNGQLFPIVDLQNLPRGDEVRTASVATPSTSWDVGEGTAMTPFNTANLIAQIAANVQTITCAVEVGLDHMADTPVEIGDILMTQIGEAMRKELDRVIAIGSTATEPSGITSASGTVAINNAAGPGAPWTLGTLESLFFGVDKALREKAYSPFFLSNDQTYARVRGMPVGASDSRRLFGESYADYRVMGIPWKVVPAMTNPQCVFGMGSRYRMWKRAGVAARWESGGQTLALKHTCMLILRGRYAGKVVDGNGFSVMTNGPA